MGTNDPWPCLVCGSTRFVELLQFTATTTICMTDPETLPVKIECIQCRSVYRQTKDYSWEGPITNSSKYDRVS